MVEFDFRYNARKVTEVEQGDSGIVGKRETYASRFREKPEWQEIIRD